MKTEDYEKTRQSLREALTELGLTMQKESEEDNNIRILINARSGNHRVMLITTIMKDRKCICIQMVYGGPLAEDRVTDAIEMANRFNATSCIANFYVLPGYNLVSLVSGLVLDHHLDKDEFKNLFGIVVALGQAHLPVIMGFKTSTIPSLEDKKDDSGKLIN